MTLLRFLFVLLTLSIAAGILMAGRQGTSALIAAPSWRTPPSPENTEEQVAQFQRVLASSVWFADADAARSNNDAQASEGDDSEPARLPLPVILAVYEIDGEIEAAFQSSNGVYQAGRVGDMVGDGWTLTAIDLHRVEAERDGEVIRRTVIARDSAPPDTDLSQPDASDGTSRRQGSQGRRRQ